MRTDITYWLRYIWLAFSVSVLVATLYFYDGNPNSEADLLLAYGMLTLAFPTSLLVAAIIGALGYLAFVTVGYEIKVTYLTITIRWFLLFATGYLQWFKLVPWMLNKRSKK